MAYNNIEEVIQLMKDKWHYPRKAIHNNKICPFLLNCQFRSKVSDNKIKNYPYYVPLLFDFWRQSCGAELFKDFKYHQWGIKIFTPDESINWTQNQKKERPDDYLETDVIFGSFLGDSDLFIIDSKTGKISVALPIDKRNEWYINIADSLVSFLNKVVDMQGEKYWEKRTFT